MWTSHVTHTHTHRWQTQTCPSPSDLHIASCSWSLSRYWVYCRLGGNCESHSSAYMDCYGLATISRLLQIIGLFCKRARQKRPIFSKETYNFKEPTNHSHPISHLSLHVQDLRPSSRILYFPHTTHDTHYPVYFRLSGNCESHGSVT